MSKRIEEIRKPTGKLIGTIYEDSNGIQSIRNQKMVLLGKYNPQEKVTRNRLGIAVARGGNALTSFLDGI